MGPPLMNRMLRIGAGALAALSLLTLGGCATGDSNAAEEFGKDLLQNASSDPRAKALCDGELGSKQMVPRGLSLQASKDSTTAEAKSLFSEAFGDDKARAQFPTAGQKFAALCIFEGDLSDIGIRGDGTYLLMYIEDGSAGGGPIATW